MNTITIEKADNGYVLKTNNKIEVFISIEDLLYNILINLTGESRYFKNSLFAELKVNRDYTKRLILIDYKE